MKKLLFLLLFSKLATAQHESPLFNFQSQKDENKFWLITGAMLINGAADAYHDLTLNNYDYFKLVHPRANDNYFNPKYSWKQKYKNNDPTQGRKFFGSKTFLVGTTDFYHATKFIQHGTFYLSITIALSSKDRIPLKNICARTVWFYGMRVLGFNFIDRYIYKHY
jgi:hypothetical protein